jgi:hypothetical protein
VVVGGLRARAAAAVVVGGDADGGCALFGDDRFGGDWAVEVVVSFVAVIASVACAVGVLDRVVGSVSVDIGAGVGGLRRSVIGDRDRSRGVSGCRDGGTRRRGGGGGA